MCSFENITISDLKFNLSPNERNNYMQWLIDNKQYDKMLSTFLHPNYDNFITCNQEKSILISFFTSDDSKVIKEFLDKKIYPLKIVSRDFKELLLKMVCKLKDGNIIKDFFGKIQFKLNENDILSFTKVVYKHDELQNQNFLLDFMKRNKDSISPIILEEFTEIFYNLKKVKSVYLLLIIKEFKNKFTKKSIMFILLAKKKDKFCTVNNEILKELEKIVKQIGLNNPSSDDTTINNEKILSILSSESIYEVYAFLRINAEKLEDKVYYQVVRRLIFLSKSQNSLKYLILYAIYQDRSLINVLYEDNPVSKLYLYINESGEFTEEEKELIKDVLKEEKKHILSPLDEGNLLDRFDKYTNNY